MTPPEDTVGTPQGSEPVSAPAAPLEGAQTAPVAADTSTDGSGDLAEMKRELAKVRKEAAGYRTKLKEHEDAQLSDQQRLEKERDDALQARESAETRARSLQVQVIATKVGVRADATGDIHALLDWKAIEDPSSDKQVEKAIRDLVKEKPYLAGRPAGGMNGGSGRGVASPDMNQLIQRAAGRG